jgi:hypothetical protein
MYGASHAESTLDTSLLELCIKLMGGGGGVILDFLDFGLLAEKNQVGLVD